MSITSELQDKIDAKAAIKASIEAKGVTVGDVKLNQYASKVDAIAQDPSIPVGSGQHLVTFYDFDGKVLKRQRVNTGEDATAPAIPTHQYLTFAEWNNPFTNVQSDIDTGAIYNTTDGKTYLFITLTPVTGIAPTLYFSKSSTSLMIINWGDGTTSTSTTSVSQSINHVYATAGNYIITVDNSAGGTWYIGQGTAATALFTNSVYKDCLTGIYFGNYVHVSNFALNTHSSINYISTGNLFTSANISGAFVNLRSLIAFICGVAIRPIVESAYAIEVFVYKLSSMYVNNNYAHTSSSNLRKIIIPPSFTSVGYALLSNCYNLKSVLCFELITVVEATAFLNCYNVEDYVFLSTTPPTLANSPRLSKFHSRKSARQLYV